MHDARLLNLTAENGTKRISMDKHDDGNASRGEGAVELSRRERNMLKYASRLAVSQFISQLETADSSHPRCCTLTFPDRRELHRHINNKHKEEISAATDVILQQGSTDAKWKALRAAQHEELEQSEEHDLPQSFTVGDNFPWLPPVGREKTENEEAKEKVGRILLFYRYRDIKNTLHVKEWQQVLCERLNLTGKIRVAGEGLNATVGGSSYATEIYMTAVMAHPLFSDMLREHFKTSPGGAHHFPDGLRVGIYKEAVPMGINPEEVTYKDAGVHLTPDEFHEAVKGRLDSDESSSQSVLIDCRNFYESKIGSFEGAVAPDIRKFSYWPEYVDQNRELFQDRNVYMYCTGGIRCERGSAYLKSKGLCKEVYQLEGGIHKYIEKYPEGYFKGKLFVFDERYAIPANETVLSACIYCEKQWDDYGRCSSAHCHQLVLICSSCRQQGRTTCCPTCQENNELKRPHEECDCTAKRVRIPVEKEKDGSSI